MSELRELQLLYIDMLKDFIKLCDSNNIDYWLDSGTLLGSIRHKGFIPWDDDLDIGVLEESIPALMTAYESDETFKKKYHFGEYNCHEYHNYFQIVKLNKDTLSTGKEVLLFIDLFPYKKYNKTLYFSFLNSLYCPIKYRTSKFYLKFFLKNIVVRIISELKGVFKSLKNPKIQEKIDIYIRNNVGINKKFLGYSHKCGFHINLYKIEKFFPLQESEFEGIRIKIPANYDEILKKLYGDYMTPPSKNKIKLHHFRDLEYKDGINDKKN